MNVIAKSQAQSAGDGCPRAHLKETRMIEQNKRIVRAFAEDIVHRGNLERIPEFFSEEYVAHDPSNPGRVGGLEGARRFISMLHAGMSNIDYAVEDMIAEGDKVVYRWQLKGTHTGVFMGVPPTGNRVAMTGIDIIRLADGKIVESWVNADAFGLLQQLGVLPPPSLVAPFPAPPSAGPPPRSVERIAPMPMTMPGMVSMPPSPQSTEGPITQRS